MLTLGALAYNTGIAGLTKLHLVRILPIHSILQQDLLATCSALGKAVPDRRQRNAENLRRPNKHSLRDDGELQRLRSDSKMPPTGLDFIGTSCIEYRQYAHRRHERMMGVCEGGLIIGLIASL